MELEEGGSARNMCPKLCRIRYDCIFNSVGGGVVAPLSTMGTTDEIVMQLKSSSAVAVATHFATISYPARRAGIAGDRIILLDDHLPRTDGSTSLTSLKNHISNSTRPDLRPEEDLAFLVFLR